MRIQPLSVAALAIAPFAPAQTASFTTYGSGCGAPGNPPPLIQAVTMPQIGAAFTVRYVALPSGQTPVSIDWPAMILGLQQAQTPVPVLSTSQPANCNFWLSTDVIQFMPWNGTSYQNTFTMLIPNDMGLLGVTFHQQWAELYSRCQPTCQPLMIRVTNAGTAVVGL